VRSGVSTEVFLLKKKLSDLESKKFDQIKGKNSILEMIFLNEFQDKLQIKDQTVSENLTQ